MRGLLFTFRKWTTRLARLRFLPAAWWFEWRHHLVFIPPCYRLQPPLTAGALVLDCGSGAGADFSEALIQRFGATCVAVDPTAKHQHGLSVLQLRSGGHFRHIAA